MATARDLDLMAWTLLGEAAGEGDKGMQAVANVILNRANSGQYPSSISEVVLQPKQFSAWNKGEGGNDPMGRYSKNSEAFKTARAIAAAAVRGELPDITGGALNYWAPRGMKGGKDPYWAKNVPEDQRLKIGNHVFLPQNPVPKAPLLGEAPIPATMSRELAYARGLADPGAALAAIQAATGSTAPASPYGTPSAYAGGGLEAVARPATTGLPYGAPASSTTGLQFTPSSINPEDFYAGMPGIRPASPPMPPEREDPYAKMFADARQAIASNKALENIPFASDDALKRLAAAKSGDGLLLNAPAGAGQYNPMQSFGAEAEPTGLTIRPVKTIPITGDTSVFDAAMRQQGPEANIARPRLTLSDIMGTARPAPGAIRTAGTEYVVPDGSVRRATMAGSNEQPMPGRPSSVPPPPPPNPLLGFGADADRFNPGAQNLPPPGPRSVAGLVTPVNTIPANMGVGFGQTPVGTIPGMGVAAAPNLVAPIPQTRPETPMVNSKGFFLGNPAGTYEVLPGETLGKVARKLKTTINDLVAANSIPDPGKIMVGAKLAVPQKAAPVPAPRPASRTSSSSNSSTPTTYTPPKQTTTSATKVSIPVYSSASITPTKVTTPVKTTTVTKPTLSQMMGTSLATGGPVQKYATGSAVLDWSGGADYQANLEKALKQVDTARKIVGVVPLGGMANAVADTFFPEQTQRAVWSAAEALAAPRSGTTTTRTTSTRDPNWSPSMMEGSPSSSSRSTSSRDRDEGRSTSSKSGSNSGSSGGIDGVIGTYNPPTQAQIDAMYAPYFKPAVFPPAGYNPGVTAEFNYFPGSGPAVPAAPATGGATTPAPAVNPALNWFNSFAAKLGDRKTKEAAKKVMADAKTSFYDLFRRYRDTLGRNAAPTAEGWQTYLSGRGYAQGGSVSEPRLVLGKGGPTSDSIPAKIDGRTEARLSNGEFVMTAAAVRGLGGGDYGKGAEALMRLNDQFDPRHNRGTLKVEKVR